VRNIARAERLPTAAKKDSAGICFVDKENFCRFVSQYLPSPTRDGLLTSTPTWW
jgi:tRNA-specific 2-thiouridylase